MAPQHGRLGWARLNHAKFFEMPVKPQAGKPAILAKKAKVVNSPKVLKTGVNSPVTTQIYA
jgi:hypothetical protein